MTTQFSKNYFVLFDLPVVYGIDVARLDVAYRELQSKIHPDRYANASEAERRHSMQWATYVNEAYQTLKKPLSRARYLITQNGVDIGEETNTAMPPDFLMQQMEWREAIIDAKSDKDVSALNAMSKRLKDEQKKLFAEIETLIDSKQDYHSAAEIVRKSRFLEKLQEEIEDTLILLETD